MREAFYDSLLSQYSIIIVDEAHERSIHTDILLFILKLIHNQRKNTKNPLKVSKALFFPYPCKISYLFHFVKFRISY